MMVIVTLLLVVISILLMVIYVLAKSLFKAEESLSRIPNEARFDVSCYEQRRQFDARQYEALMYLISGKHNCVEYFVHKLTGVRARLPFLKDESDVDAVRRELLSLQCYLLDVWEIATAPANDEKIHHIRDIRENLRQSWPPSSREEQVGHPEHVPEAKP